MAESYKEKYLKYKQKYLQLKYELEQDGGIFKAAATSSGWYLFIVNADYYQSVKNKLLKDSKDKLQTGAKVVSLYEMNKLFDFHGYCIKSFTDVLEPITNESKAEEALAYGAKVATLGLTATAFTPLFVGSAAYNSVFNPNPTPSLSSLAKSAVDAGKKFGKTYDENISKLTTYSIGAPYLGPNEDQLKKLSQKQKDDLIVKDNLRILKFIMEKGLCFQMNFKEWVTLKTLDSVLVARDPKFMMFTVNISHFGSNTFQYEINPHDPAGPYANTLNTYLEEFKENCPKDTKELALKADDTATKAKAAEKAKKAADKARKAEKNASKINAIKA